MCCDDGMCGGEVMVCVVVQKAHLQHTHIHTQVLEHPLLCLIIGGYMKMCIVRYVGLILVYRFTC